MFDLLCAAAFAVIITALAWATRTGPATIGRHIAVFPGTVFVGATTGAFVALAVWGLSMPFGAEQPPLRLAIDGAAWALLHIVLEAGNAPGPAPGEERGARHRA
jgi:hypothetical protein